MHLKGLERVNGQQKLCLGIGMGIKFKESHWILQLEHHWLLNIKSHESCERRNKTEEVNELREVRRGSEHRMNEDAKSQRKRKKNVLWSQGTGRKGFVVWMSSVRQLSCLKIKGLLNSITVRIQGCIFKDLIGFSCFPRHEKSSW